MRISEILGFQPSGALLEIVEKINTCNNVFVKK